ncbi:phosphopentomutase [Colwelliaceae bacterium 6441]
MARAIILVVDSFGIGQAPDADKFGDLHANTFAHLAQVYYQNTHKKIALPYLASMGLVDACLAAGKEEFPVESYQLNKGAFGYAAEMSSGKDTPSGHWEMTGVPVLFDWGYFDKPVNSFPAKLLNNIAIATGFERVLGNCHASGTDIIARLGQQHIQTGLPICYTSADSVFQVAAHEEHFGLDNLYHFCEKVRELLDDYNIGRVIARPFIGDDKHSFVRTGNRRDYSVLPPAATLLDKLTQAGGHVISVGKIADIFAHQGISEKTKATGIDALIDATLLHMQTAKDKSLIFTNLVNFDQDFGHRRDAIGYAEALESFDKRLPEIFSQLNDDDILFITADHGCDPTWHGSDHTREYVPVLAYHNHLASIELGERATFADLGQTIAEMFALEKLSYGKSFYKKLI